MSNQRLLLNKQTMQKNWQLTITVKTFLKRQKLEALKYISH